MADNDPHQHWMDTMFAQSPLPAAEDVLVGRDDEYLLLGGDDDEPPKLQMAADAPTEAEGMDLDNAQRPNGVDLPPASVPTTTTGGANSRQGAFIPLTVEPDRLGGKTTEEEYCSTQWKWVEKKCRSMPLLDYLCVRQHCSLQELQLLFLNIGERKKLLEHVRAHLLLYTSHRKDGRRELVRCHDFTCESAQTTMACGGYLGITVRQYMYVRHRVRLLHPYLPCVIEHGGGRARSYYPLELLTAHFD
jgi:hypothetical protein